MIQHTGVAAESNKSWKRCSSHVYISRLIKVLQISDRKEGWAIQPTSFQNADNQILRTNGRNCNTYFSAIDLEAAEKDSSETRKGILLHKRPTQDQQMSSETSAKQVGSLLDKLCMRIWCLSESLILAGIRLFNFGDGALWFGHGWECKWSRMFTHSS